MEILTEINTFRVIFHISVQIKVSRVPNCKSGIAISLHEGSPKFTLTVPSIIKIFILLAFYCRLLETCEILGLLTDSSLTADDRREQILPDFNQYFFL